MCWKPKLFVRPLMVDLPVVVGVLWYYQRLTFQKRLH